MDGESDIVMSRRWCLITLAIAVTAACAEPNNGKEFRDCETCPVMVRVAAGEYTMGSPVAERNRDDDEGPAHEVTIGRDIAVGKFETTWSEWQACGDDGVCQAPFGHSMPEGSGWGKGQRPVINVSWDDVQLYLSWISEKTGQTYRLPTEAEWEYAARAGTQTRYRYGDEAETICRVGNGADLATNFNNPNKCYDGTGRKTAVVGSYEANAFGVFDTIGNVWEWTEDCWNSDYNNAPTGGEARLTGDCTQRTIRGGSWGSYPHMLRFATRQGLQRSYRGHEVGFRVVRVVNAGGP